jgi:ParB family chromosome partitioning protein
VSNILHSSESNEYYTPSQYIESARIVMGSIDLDPASCEFANETVMANEFYTKEDNGLVQQWHGNVWLNPPYGKSIDQNGKKKSNAMLWSQKLIREHNENGIQAILLVNAVTACKWFKPRGEKDEPKDNRYTKSM